MAWNYRNRIKVIPGVYINLSTGGISTSVGTRGLSVTLGSNGAYLNTSIPGTGIYKRRKISSSKKSQATNKEASKQDPVLYHSIESESLEEITSASMERIRQAIFNASQMKVELKAEIEDARLVIVEAEKKISIFQWTLLKYILPGKYETWRENVANAEELIRNNQSAIQTASLTLNIDFDDEMSRKYLDLVYEFTQVTNSRNIWDVSGSRWPVSRTLITYRTDETIRIEVYFRFGEILEIDSKIRPLMFFNANGPDIYLYPSFVILKNLYSSELAVIDFSAISMECHIVNFEESEEMPTDCEIVGHTWEKANKDGSRNMRYKDNKQIPLVRYGEISIRTATGINERYHVSNPKLAASFVRAFKEYQDAVCNLNAKNFFGINVGRTE